MRVSVLILLAALPALGADFQNFQAARLVIGQVSFTREDPTSTQTVLGGAGGVAVAGSRLFVVDSNRIGANPANNRVLIYNSLSSFVTPPDVEIPQGANCPACVGSPDTVLGQPDFATFTAGLQTGLNNPTAVASDGAHLAVADTDNNRVLIWNTIPSGNNTPPDVVVGQPDFKTNLPTTSQTGLRGPQGVWFANGKLIIADTQNARVLIYNSIPSANGAKADIELGEPDFTTRPSPNLNDSNVKPTASSMLDPTSATTTGNKLIVTDLGFNRVMIFNSFPNSNNAAADVVVGQPDMNSGAYNNSGPNSPLCAPLRKDDQGNNVFPSRCLATLSFPRFALSDGTRLFIADGGNDRVLIYNALPTANGQAADVLIGQPDPTQLAEDLEGAEALRTPSALAWDGANLYVADPFNRRISVFTPAEQMISPGGIVNAASYAVHAEGTVTLDGTPVTGDNVKLTINGTDYTYTIADGDTLQTISDALVHQINEDPGDPNAYARPFPSDGTYATGGVKFDGDIRGGDVITVTVNGRSYNYTVAHDDTVPGLVYNFIDIINNQNHDPDVFADPDPTDQTILRLTAHQVGEPGNNIAYSASVSFGAHILATPEGGTLSGGKYKQNITLVAISAGSDGDNITFSVTPSSTNITGTTSGANLSDGNDATEAPPGTQIAIFGQNLAASSATADLSSGSLPRSLGGAAVYINGIQAPLYFVTPTQINAQVPFEIEGDSVSIYVRSVRADGSVAVSIARAIPTPRAAPGLYAIGGGPEPRTGAVVHGMQFAKGTVAIDLSGSGSTADQTQNVPAGIQVQITVNGRTYQYTTVDGDTTDSVRDTMVGLINAGPGDPDVLASSARVGFLSARSTVTLDGKIHAGDVVTITINSRNYSYTVQASDNLTTVANRLIAAINAGPGDADVTAALSTSVGTNAIDIVARQLGSQTNSITIAVSASSGAQITITTDAMNGTLGGGSTPSAVVLTARKPGKGGNDVTYSAFVPDGSAITATAQTASLCCGNDFFAPVTADNPAIPGETIVVFATGLGLTNPSFGPDNGLETGKKVPTDTLFLVPANPSDFVSSLAGGKTAEVDFVGLMPGQVGVYQVNLILNSSLPDNPMTPLTIAQGLFVSNVIAFPVQNRVPVQPTQ
ncbi:MAG TPA: hypothetical protein VEU62_12170 [Bryobacterales bacterium]|nr:hypothetical protein [Bryobacterales bacterium]